MAYAAHWLALFSACARVARSPRAAQRSKSLNISSEMKRVQLLLQDMLNYWLVNAIVPFFVALASLFEAGQVCTGPRRATSVALISFKAVSD
jgi:hypothetical protein